MALKEAGESAQDATMYVNLEPCCHYGRTPPCVDAIIRAGIKKVFIAVTDPNPLVSGQGIHALQNAGIEIDVGLCDDEAIYLNRFFIHYILNQRPYVIAKWAMSVDGKIATSRHCSQWISGEESRKHAHDLRHGCDAILIGAKTALMDNPSVTSRNILNAKQPKRIILDTHGSLPLNLKIFNDDHKRNTILVTSNKNLRIHDIEILIIDLPTDYGYFQAFSFKSFQDNKEHFVLMKNLQPESAILVRIHSECLTGDVFGSLKCDCASQLDNALKKIAHEESAIVIYLRQEGRGIGLINKMKAYALQEQGYDTAEANTAIGCDVDNREYSAACAILKHLYVKKKIRLLTNNPCKLDALKVYWRNYVFREELPIVSTIHNRSYIETKINKLRHFKGKNI